MTSILLKVAILLAVLAGTSCMTTYDAYGRPVQTVDPGAAAIGIAAAGIAGYAIGHNHNHHHHYRPYYCY